MTKNSIILTAFQPKAMNPITFQRRNVPRQVADELLQWLSQSDFSRPRLPSVRMLAEQFRIIPNTANAALRILAESGVIRLIPRQGAFVIDVKNDD